VFVGRNEVDESDEAAARASLDAGRKPESRP
jgi:hypothetical protein